MATLERQMIPPVLEKPFIQETDEDEAAEPMPFLWTKDQYHAMADLGWFNDLRVELIEGEIIRMAAMGSGHFTGVYLVQRALIATFGDGFMVVSQGSFDLDCRSEPEPDVQVIIGTGREYKDVLPTSSLLFVEVSDKTLRYDRTKKASLYARAGIADYWIVNLQNRQVEVLREPQADASAVFGHRYASVTIIPADGVLSPLAKPDAIIPAADLLP